MPYRFICRTACRSSNRNSHYKAKVHSSTYSCSLSGFSSCFSCQILADSLNKNFRGFGNVTKDSSIFNFSPFPLAWSFSSTWKYNSNLVFYCKTMVLLRKAEPLYSSFNRSLKSEVYSFIRHLEDFSTTFLAFMTSVSCPENAQSSWKLVCE